ncbi:hypothetical protein K1T71_001152 [Dendrolimus kikuchii]|uniref:Uncharacterized protein n=1 Tax=Dendrolimus kikuchii TaxID=765133 RepID=A0ACC1DH02_9NEOP|nr:hypothetical protein K1T71_001152 [Dendrolimus kikuchii]
MTQSQPDVASLENLVQCPKCSQARYFKAWEDLLQLPYKILNIKHNESGNLTTKIKKRCQNLPELDDLRTNSNIRKTDKESTYRLNRFVEAKLSDGDIKGAARILFSNDTIAPNNETTLRALEEKHPHSDAALGSSLVCLEESLVAAPKSVFTSVMSFRSGSAGGLDGLTPQHLKDLLGGSTGTAGETLLKDITDLINLMLSGAVNNDVVPTLYGANLCALNKKDGGIRPIAVGTTYRRLAAKICCREIADLSSSYFATRQLGFGVKGGCEAAVHSLRTFASRDCCQALLKVDVKNAFNSVNRATLLAQVRDKSPRIFNFIHQCYCDKSILMYQNHKVFSETGCQQGDPLGPAIFSLAIHPIIEKLNSKFNVWYLDDGTLGGDIDTLKKDIQYLIYEFDKIGLELNYSKCEIYFSDKVPNIHNIISDFQSLGLNFKIVDKNSLSLLGCPVFEESFSTFVSNKIQNFQSKIENLKSISLHSAYYIIRYCIFTPNFIYILRCCPIWQNQNILKTLDNVIRYSLSSIFNIPFDDRTWTQASLPIRYGGLGIRKISAVSLPAFLSSVYSTKDLIGEILNPSLGDFEVLYLTEARNAWSVVCPYQNLPINLKSQKLWDGPLCSLVHKNLLDTCAHETERARLLAVSRWESGLWLQALPSANLGTFLDDNAFRISACIRLGAACVVPHRCQCGDKVERLGHHGLSCSRSAGRISRHATLNDIIRRALVTAGVPAVLEPNGLCRDDGRRPDGMSLVPWKMGRPLVWDASCVDTLAASHLPATSMSAGTAADSGWQRAYLSL